MELKAHVGLIESVMNIDIQAIARIWPRDRPEGESWMIKTVIMTLVSPRLTL
jgi:hypothetical protein